MNEEYQRMAANAICHAAEGAKSIIQEVALSYGTPSAIYRPELSIDGDRWCALYGKNLHDGVSGFGKSPAEAMAEFDRAWYRKHEIRREK